jgi:hypothetical protein
MTPVHQLSPKEDAQKLRAALRLLLSSGDNGLEADMHEPLVMDDGETKVCAICGDFWHLCSVEQARRVLADYDGRNS